MFHPSGHSPDEAGIEMSGHILSAGGGGGDWVQAADNYTSSHRPSASPMHFCLSLHLSSSLLPLPPALSILKAIQYQHHLILLCSQKLPGGRSNVSFWTAEG